QDGLPARETPFLETRVDGPIQRLCSRCCCKNVSCKRRHHLRWRRSWQSARGCSCRSLVLQIPMRSIPLLLQNAKSHWRDEGADGKPVSALSPVRETPCKSALRTVPKSLSQMLRHPQANVPKLNQLQFQEASPTPCRQSPGSSVTCPLQSWRGRKLTHYQRSIRPTESK